MRKKISAFLLSLAVAASAFMQLPAFADYEKVYELKTNANPEYYSDFTVSGFTLSAHGKYTDDPINSIYMMGWDIEKYSLKALQDGSYTAEITCPSYTRGNAILSVVFESGMQVEYEIYADENGVYFPDNLLGKSSTEKFQHIIKAPNEAAAYYLSATADKDEILKTQNELKALADEITKGVDDQYLQALLICRWVADNIYYDSDASHTSVTLETVAISNVLKIKRTVCAGYANTCSALMAAKGIRSVNIKGSCAAVGVSYETLPTGVENHEWSAFYYEKEQRWVYVDSCWCSGNSYYNGSYYGGITHDNYFDILPLAFSFDHRVDKVEERDYFADFSGLEDETSETSESSDTVTQTSEITASPETSPEATSFETSSENTIEASPASNSDNTILVVVLISIASALLIGVIVIALYIKKRNGKNQ